MDWWFLLIRGIIYLQKAQNLKIFLKNYPVTLDSCQLFTKIKLNDRACIY